MTQDKQNNGVMMAYQAVHVEGADRVGRWLVTCDHATNHVPEALGGSLGLPDSEMQRHIAWDPGAAGVAHALGEALQAPVITSNFSRLVIDPNRGEDDPTLLMKLYDGTIIPGNRHADAEELERRKSLCYRPYHETVAEFAARQPDTVLVSVHSFTPQLKGRAARPWPLGILYSHMDPRLANGVMAHLAKVEPDLQVGDNQPYDGHLPGDAVDRHALRHNRLNILLELRQDLIETQTAQRAWAERLAPPLKAGLAAIAR